MHQDVHQQQHESVCILNGAHQGCAKLEKQIICTQENYQNCLFGGCLAGNKCHHVTRSLCSGSLDEINNNISGGNPGTQYRTVGGESGDQIVQQSFQLCPRGLTSLLVKKKYQHSGLAWASLLDIARAGHVDFVISPHP